MKKIYVFEELDGEECRLHLDDDDVVLTVFDGESDVEIRFEKSVAGEIADVLRSLSVGVEP